MSPRTITKIALGVVAAGAGVYLVNRYALKPDGPIPIAGGFGADDVAQGAGALMGVALVQAVMRKAG